MKLKPEDFKKILELRNNGATIEEIANLFGISKRRVLQILKNGGIKIPGRKKIIVPEEIQETILKLRFKGMTISAIQSYLKEHGIHLSKYKIWQVLREHQFEEYSNRSITIMRTWPVVLWIDLFTLTTRNNRKIKVFVILDLKKCEIKHLEPLDSITLKQIISAFDSAIISESTFNPRDTLVLMPRIPPFVPTKGETNRLIRHFLTLGISYQLVSSKMPLKIRRNFIREMSLMLQTLSPSESEFSSLQNFIMETCNLIWNKIENNMEMMKNGYI